MANPPRQKGTLWESTILPVLQRVWKFAQRTGSRAYELGDFANTGRYVIEAKDHKTITLAAYMDQAKKAAARVPGGIPVVIVKRRRKNVLQAYVVMELGDWIREKEETKTALQQATINCGECRRRHLPNERCGYDRT